MKRKEKLEIMKQYLLLKLDEADYHGVMDAAADMREIVLAMKISKDSKFTVPMACIQCGHTDIYSVVDPEE